MYFLFDIGGTNTRVALSDGKKVAKAKSFPTPQSFDEGLQALVGSANELSGGKAFTAAAGGIAGPLDAGRQMLVNSTNLPEWVGKPLVSALKKKLQAPIFLENDTALVGQGEAAFGAGQGSAIMAYLTVSTGLGGARYVDGLLDKSSLGFEPGHQLIPVPEEYLALYQPCASCDTMDLEALVSGGGLLRSFGMRAEDINDERIWENCAFFLASGLHNVIVYWSPDTIVLGGPLIKSGKISLARVRENLRRTMKIFPKLPAILTAKFDGDGGLYGALSLVRSRLAE